MENAHPEIPNGFYCYGEGTFDEKTGKHIIKLCPHWEQRLINGYPGAYCKFLKEESEYKELASLLWDQVKECHINMDDGE